VLGTIDTARAQTYKIFAKDSVCVSAPTNTVWRDNRVRAYNNGTTDIHGLLQFDVSSIPDSAKISAMRLTLYMENAFGSPKGSPVVNLHYSADDSWTRASATATSGALGPILTAKQANFVFPTHSFLIDLKAHNFAADLVDNTITLAIDNVNSSYSYVYFFGPSGSPSGPNAELEIVVGGCTGFIRTFGTGGLDSTKTTFGLAFTGCPAPGRVVFANLKAGSTISSPGFLFLGASDTKWLGLTLPFDLRPLGAAGNMLYASIDIGPATIPISSGAGTMPIPIPNLAAFRGVRVYVQGILYDNKANGLNLVFSNGGDLTIY